MFRSETQKLHLVLKIYEKRTYEHSEKCAQPIMDNPQNEPRGGPGGPGSGLGCPGGGFLTLVSVVACHYFYYCEDHPQDHPNHHQHHQDHPGARFMGCLLWVVNMFPIYKHHHFQLPKR